MKGLLRLHECLSLIQDELFECVYIDELVCVEHKLAYFLLFVGTVWGRRLLLTREVKQVVVVFLEERLVSLGG